ARLGFSFPRGDVSFGDGEWLFRRIRARCIAGFVVSRSSLTVDSAGHGRVVHFVCPCVSRPARTDRDAGNLSCFSADIEIEIYVATGRRGITPCTAAGGAPCAGLREAVCVGGLRGGKGVVGSP